MGEKFEYSEQERKNTFPLYDFLIIGSLFAMALLLGYLFCLVSDFNTIKNISLANQMCSFSLEGNFDLNTGSQLFPEGIREIFPNLKINKISGSIPCNSRILESVVN